MAITVSELILKNETINNPQDYELRPVTLTGEEEIKILAEMAKWEFITNTEESMRHEEMGDYDYGCTEKREAFVELAENCIVSGGKLIGIKRYGTIFFTDGTAPVGSAGSSSSTEDGRTTYYTDSTYSIKKLEGDVNLTDNVTYRGAGKNPYDTVVSVKRDAVKVTLHPDVKNIAENAFENCSELLEIDIPSGVTTIPVSAFAGCKSLKRVKLPASLKGIEHNAFEGCYDLSDIEFPSELEYIAWAAFRKCESLKEIVIPDSVREIYSHAFEGCESLVKVTLPE